MQIEHEVYSAAFDAYLDPIKCSSKEAADKVKDALRDISGRKFGSSCGWEIREVVDRKGPIPPKADVISPILVDEVRKLMAKHGQDCIVTISWNMKDGLVNVATAGSDRLYSECAYDMSKKIAAAIGCDPVELEKHEDRRHEHENA